MIFSSENSPTQNVFLGSNSPDCFNDCLSGIMLVLSISYLLHCLHVLSQWDSK